MNYTHQKRIYRAKCIQLSAENFNEVTALLAQHDGRAVQFRDGLMVRWGSLLSRHFDTETMNIGNWLRIGENGEAKIMSNEEFKSKYVKLELKQV